jgi:hypothetical protein
MGGLPTVGNDQDPFVPFPAPEVVAPWHVQASPYEQRQDIFGQKVFFATPGALGGGGGAGLPAEPANTGPAGEEPPGVRPDRPGYGSVAGPALAVGPFAAPLLSAGELSIPIESAEMHPHQEFVDLTGTGPAMPTWIHGFRVIEPLFQEAPELAPLPSPAEAGPHKTGVSNRWDDSDCFKSKTDREVFHSVEETCYQTEQEALKRASWLNNRQHSPGFLISSVYFNKKKNCWEIHLEARRDKRGERHPDLPEP